MSKLQHYTWTVRLAERWADCKCAWCECVLWCLAVINSPPKRPPALQTPPTPSQQKHFNK